MLQVCGIEFDRYRSEYNMYKNGVPIGSVPIQEGQLTFILPMPLVFVHDDLAAILGVLFGLAFALSVDDLVSVPDPTGDEGRVRWACWGGHGYMLYVSEGRVG
jgi:hypothetical protein